MTSNNLGAVLHAFQTACSLVQAVERAESEGRDWAMKHENLVQARADEQTFREVLEKARATQQVSTVGTRGLWLCEVLIDCIVSMLKL